MSYNSIDSGIVTWRGSKDLSILPAGNSHTIPHSEVPYPPLFVLRAHQGHIVNHVTFWNAEGCDVPKPFSEEGSRSHNNSNSRMQCNMTLRDEFSTLLDNSDDSSSDEYNDSPVHGATHHSMRRVTPFAFRIKNLSLAVSSDSNGCVIIWDLALRVSLFRFCAFDCARNLKVAWFKDIAFRSSAEVAPDSEDSSNVVTEGIDECGLKSDNKRMTSVPAVPSELQPLYTPSLMGVLFSCCFSSSLSQPQHDYSSNIIEDDGQLFMLTQCRNQRIYVWNISHTNIKKIKKEKTTTKENGSKESDPGTEALPSVSDYIIPFSSLATDPQSNSDISNHVILSPEESRKLKRESHYLRLIGEAIVPQCGFCTPCVWQEQSIGGDGSRDTTTIGNLITFIIIPRDNNGSAVLHGIMPNLVNSSPPLPISTDSSNKWDGLTRFPSVEVSIARPGLRCGQAMCMQQVPMVTCTTDSSVGQRRLLCVGYESGHIVVKDIQVGWEIDGLVLKSVGIQEQHSPIYFVVRSFPHPVTAAGLLLLAPYISSPPSLDSCEEEEEGTDNSMARYALTAGSAEGHVEHYHLSLHIMSKDVSNNSNCGILHSSTVKVSATLVWTKQYGKGVGAVCNYRPGLPIILLGGWDGKVRLLDARSGAIITILPFHKNSAISSICFSSSLSNTVNNINRNPSSFATAASAPHNRAIHNANARPSSGNYSHTISSLSITDIEAKTPLEIDTKAALVPSQMMNSRVVFATCSADGQVAVWVIDVPN